MRLIKTILPISPIGLIGLIGLIALTLTACSGGGNGSGGIDDLDDTPLVSGGSDETTPISFSCGLAESQSVTRATGMLSTYREEFKVWGYKNMTYAGNVYDSDGNKMQTIFPGYYNVTWEANTAYTTSSNTNNWEYVSGDQTIKFWDWSARAYRFFGATNWKAEGPYEYNDAYGADGTYEAGTYKTYEISMSVDASPALDGESKYDAAATATKMADMPYFSHLWFSTGDPVAYADKQFGKPVTLEFLKPYARVRFIFKYVYPREGIKLTSISFKPSDDTKKIARKGTVTISYPLNGTKTEEWFSISDVDAGADLIDFTEDYDPEDDGKEYIKTDNGWYTVLPNDEQGSYKMSVKVNGDPKTAVVPATYMQWLPGYSYTYIFKITDEGGVEIGGVEYAVIKWNEMEATHSVYNW